ncbi:(Fe-S)-binding protein [Solidesulfovibrio sp.]|uniref:(Fe-S)-binding protein n=1 Tax=Solidesulfovibrio sp. TaxID=2910990 RepID=UPI002B1F3289|nr:(Fe-S)-binding protein [Solidesulfovibrio sp.]MEA5087763.1 (Fe-S)-binding protein [Solidesulfovibrio sp.]HML61130.1 (Fe-S)-binding protein [Solidesulfovibrio sp.]
MEASLRDELVRLFDTKLSRQMLLNLETCSRCGLCTPACHAYASMPLPKYAPAFRAEVVRRIYKRYFTALGRFAPVLGEAKPLTDAALEELREAAYSCTGCRRCMVYCPFGIDTQQIMSIAKLLLIGAEAAPEILSLLADVSISKGESIETFKEGFLQGIKRLETQVVARWKVEAGTTPIPTEVEGADMLYVALAGAHSIIPAAVVFNAARENWTLSFFEAVNFGAFVGDPGKTQLILDRIVREALRLGVKEVCICECGTAVRVAKQLSGTQPFRVVSLTEVHARYLREGRIRVKKLPGSHTYHDPCQIARNGGVYDEPRAILGRIVEDFREMSPDPKYNWCCGGGGGLVAMGEDTLDFRMRSSRVKADQIRESRADVVVTACENCHTQLENINAHYGLGKEVKFLSSLLADALVAP